MAAPSLPQRPVRRTIQFLALLAVLGWSPPGPASSAQDSEGSLAAFAGDRLLPMPLQRTEVQVEITGFVARVEVRQVFANPFEIPIEAVYRFPLSDRGAVDDMVIQVGPRRIQGRIKRRKEAKAEYEKARSEGRRAALLDQERPNVFTQNVANILPGEAITVHLRYVEPLEFARGTYSFTFPMVVAPRFSPPGSAWNPGPADSPALPFTNPDILPAEQRSGSDIALTVNLEAGVPLAGLTSPTHAIDIEREGDSRATVRLASPDRIPNKDFVLEFTVGGTVPETAVLAHRNSENAEGYFLLILQPENFPEPEETVPKELIFIMDTSGSMDGIPLVLSKQLVSQAIEKLGAQDTFNIVAYAESAQVLWDRSRDTGFVHRQIAGEFAQGLKAEGGTMLLVGLLRALELPRDPDRLRIVLLLTDGLVSNEEEIFLIKDLLQGARLFTIGIGSAPNRYLVSRLAQVGRGEVRFFSSESNAAQPMNEFFDHINHPILTDLSIDWGSLKVQGLHPDPLPDLYAGQALRLLGRYRWEAEDTVILKGRLGRGLWEKRLPVLLPAQEGDHEALAHVWARQHIDDLMLEKALPSEAAVQTALREEITSLALAHGIMTPYTSFVAVEEGVIANPDLSFQSVDQAAMVPADMTIETLCVRASSPVVSLGMGGGSYFPASGESYSDLPALGREYQSVLALAPGVQNSVGDGNPTVLGSRQREFKMTVDSASSVDPLTGEFLSNLNPDAIDEIEVLDAGAGASFGGAVGAFGLISTKSGSNQFEGTISVTMRADSAAQATLLPGRSAAPQGKRFDGFFSGPLAADRVWFSMAHSVAQESDGWITGKGKGYSQSRTLGSHLDKLVWQQGPHRRWIASFQSEPYEVYPAGVDSVTPPATGFKHRVTNPGYGWRGDFISSPTFFMELSGHLTALTSETEPFAPHASNDCRAGCSSISGTPLSRVYCEDFSRGRRSGPFFRRDREERRRGSLTAKGEQFIGDWLGGTHRIIGGLEVIRNSSDYRYRETPQLIREKAWSADGGDPDSRLFLLGNSYPGHSSLSGEVTRMAAYLTDSFEPLDNLRIEAGVRLTRQVLKGPGFQPFRPQREARKYHSLFNQCLEGGGSAEDCARAHLKAFTASPFDDPRGYENCGQAPHPQVCQLLASLPEGAKFRVPESLRLAHQAAEPRVNISWDPGNDGKSKFFLSWGRYGADLDPRLVFLEGTPDRSYAPFMSRDSGRLEPSGTLSPAFRTRVVQRRIKPPSSQEWTAGFAREIGVETALEISLISRRIGDQWQQTDLNHRNLLWDELTAADRSRYPDCRQLGRWADCTGVLTSEGLERPDGLPDRIVQNPWFNEVLLVGDRRTSRSRRVVITLDRRFFHNWGASFSYTWSGSRSSAAEFGSGIPDRVSIGDLAEGPFSGEPNHLVLVSGNWFIPRWSGFWLGVLGVYQQGLPYSLLENRVVVDFPAPVTLPGDNRLRQTRVQYAGLRTTYPSGKANDRRNGSFWHIDLVFRKEFTLAKAKSRLDLEILNLCDRRPFILQRVERLAAGPPRAMIPVGAEASGRQYRLTAKVMF